MCNLMLHLRTYRHVADFEAAVPPAWLAIFLGYNRTASPVQDL